MTSIEGRTFLLAKKIDASLQEYQEKDLFGGPRPSGEHPAPGHPQMRYYLISWLVRLQYKNLKKKLTYSIVYSWLVQLDV